MLEASLLYRSANPSPSILTFSEKKRRRAASCPSREDYAIDRLGSLPWLREKPLYYWGDIDTHGFAILSRLRRHWEHARSLLMDRVRIPRISSSRSTR
jgi:hypothetical protein